MVGMRGRDEGTAAKPRGDVADERGKLEAELEAARQAILRILWSLQGEPMLGVGELGVSDAAAYLSELIAARMEELSEKTHALEGANAELRSLTRNLDQIVRQRTRALAESESQLRRKNVELDRLNRMRTEFIAVAAHELRTPLTSIVGYLDLFIERTPPDVVGAERRQLTSLHRNAHRLKRLVEDMLDVSRLEFGGVSLRRGACDLGEIVLAVVDEFRPIAGDTREISADLTAIPPVDGDADRLHQVVSNLVANSLKFTADGGEIRLTVDGTDTPDDGPMARLRVWDNGRGIPPAVQSRIFEPFADVVTARHHTSVGPDSAGLGLRIARGIVELHGGHVHVESAEGRYTEFTVLLPLA
jgi:signal transduction histidine kinase